MIMIIITYYLHHQQHIRIIIIILVIIIILIMIIHYRDNQRGWSTVSEVWYSDRRWLDSSDHLLSIYLSISPLIQSIYVSIYASIHQSLYLSFNQSIYLFILSTNLFIYLCIYQSTHPSILSFNYSINSLLCDIEEYEIPEVDRKLGVQVTYDPTDVHLSLLSHDLYGCDDNYDRIS